MNVSTCILEYINIKEPFLKESTNARYTNLYINYIKDAFNQIEIVNLTNYIIQNYCDQKIKEGISLITIKEVVLLLKLATKRYNKLNELRPLIIDLDLPKISSKRKIEVFSKNDIKIIINYILLNDKLKFSGIVISLLTGIRIGEICALKWTDIDLKKRIIKIEKTLQRICLKNQKSKIIVDKPKTKSSIRIIPIGNFLFDFLIDIKPTNRDFYVLTGNNSFKEPRSYRKIFGNLLKKLKIKYIHFHALRHTFATRLIENKTDIKTISELLGHSSPTITISIYVHSEFATKRKAIKELDKQVLKWKQ